MSEMRNNRDEKSKKAQEEIVGFVAIVLIVSIIMIVFLGIFLRKDKSGPGNTEVSQFLDALMETTTRCSTDGFNYKEYLELMKFCNQGGECSGSGEKACDILNKYTKEMIEDSWKFGGENAKKGYIYELNFIAEDSDEKELIIKGGRGPAGTTKYIGSERPISVNDGSIVISLDLYLE